MRVKNVFHFHYHFFVIQVDLMTKTDKLSFTIPSTFFQLMLSSDKAVLKGEQNMGKAGKMEILNWKFNEQSSRHGQLRATFWESASPTTCFTFCCDTLTGAKNSSLTKHGQQHFNSKTWPIYIGIALLANLRMLCLRRIYHNLQKKCLFLN